MSTALRPSLRPLSHPSLTSLPSSSTYICQPCRHARLLRRPKRPYTFTQLVTLSDGSAFTIRTTSPQPVYRSTRDTRNAPLWNPSSKELLNVEEDEAGRLAGFRARFGTGFDASKEAFAATNDAEKDEKKKPEAKAQRVQLGDEFEEDFAEEDFAEDDMNLLELISSFGQEHRGGGGQIKKGGKSK